MEARTTPSCQQCSCGSAAAAVKPAEVPSHAAYRCCTPTAGGGRCMASQRSCADKARFKHVLRVCPQPAEFAEWQAINTQQLLIRASQLAKGIMAGSQTGTCCLRAAEHLVLASWQYLSTVLQDSPRSQRSRDFGTTEHFVAATNAQQQLTNSSTGLSPGRHLPTSRARSSQENLQHQQQQRGGTIRPTAGPRARASTPCSLQPSAR
jgi:hypothetical protein